MLASFNAARATGALGAYCSPTIGARMPIDHPSNCKHECPYGYGRSFCFPCYKKIMEDHRKKKNEAEQGE